LTRQGKALRAVFIVFAVDVINTNGHIEQFFDARRVGVLEGNLFFHLPMEPTQELIL
jgi:hypothetical protein